MVSEVNRLVVRITSYGDDGWSIEADGPDAVTRKSGLGGFAINLVADLIREHDRARGAPEIGVVAFDGDGRPLAGESGWRKAHDAAARDRDEFRAQLIVLRGEVRHAHLLLDREERASEGVTSDLWAVRQGLGYLCEILGIAADDERTDDETRHALAGRAMELCERLGVGREDMGDQDAVDARRARIEAVLSGEAAPTIADVERRVRAIEERMAQQELRHGRC